MTKAGQGRHSGRLGHDAVVVAQLDCVPQLVLGHQGDALTALANDLKCVATHKGGRKARSDALFVWSRNWLSSLFIECVCVRERKGKRRLIRSRCWPRATAAQVDDLQGQVHAIGCLGFDPHHRHGLGGLEFHGLGNTSQQTTSTTTDEDHVHVWHLCQDLSADSAIASNEAEVVDGVHKLGTKLVLMLCVMKEHDITLLCSVFKSIYPGHTSHEVSRGHDLDRGSHGGNQLRPVLGGILRHQHSAFQALLGHGIGKGSTIVALKDNGSETGLTGFDQFSPADSVTKEEGLQALTSSLLLSNTFSI